MTYNGEDRQFSATQALSMLLTKAKDIVKMNNPGTVSVDAVFSVPAYFTQAQRQAVRDAAAIAGFNCLRVLNDGTAAALNYGIFKSAKKEFPEGKDTKVMLLDMGASAFTTTIAAFTNGSLKVLSSVSDSELGGRNLDVAIAKWCAAEFKAKTGLDAWKSRKARIKLFVAAEKAKVSISPYGVNQAPISVECLLEERDLSLQLTTEKLEELMGAELNERITRTMKKCMERAGVKSAADVAAIELVGGGMRPRLVKRIAASALGLALDEATGHGLSQSMNLDEAIARGCALSCAMLSPVFKVKPFEIVDTVAYPVKVSWEPVAASAAEADAGAMEDEEGEGGANAAANAGSAAAPASSMTIFKIGDASPITRRLTFRRAAPFDISAEYEVSSELTGMFPEAAAPFLGKFTVTGFPGDLVTDTAAPAPKVRVDFKHDMNGMFVMAHAEVLKEIKEEAAPEAPKDEAAMADAAPAAADAAAAPAPAAEGPKKKRFKRVELSVVPAANPIGLTHEQMKAAIAAEHAMQAADDEVRARQDMRNSLEAYIYSTRNALEDSLQNFSTPKQREDLSSALATMEDWLYNDGFEADKQTYQAKLAELKKMGDPIFTRKTESEGRYAASEALKEAIERFRAVEQNKEGKHGHLGESDRDTLRAAIREAEAWYRAKHEAQGKLEMYEDPVLRVADINAAREKLVRELTPIANRPVPAPPAPAPAPAPAAAPAAAETPAPAAEGAAPAPAENKMEE